MTEQEIRTKISQLKTFWNQRNVRFREWYEILILLDVLSARGLESYASNEPQTFYDMAHFLLTRGDLSHAIPIEGESTLEYDRRAKVDRACKYMWSKIDRERQLGGSMSFKDELGFYLLILGWYSVAYQYEEDKGILSADIWNPFNVFPQYAGGKLTACVHSVIIPEDEAIMMAEDRGWFYQPRHPAGDIRLDDFWKLVGDTYHNVILIDDRPVTGWVPRPEVKLVVSPVAGFPDKGSLSQGKVDWKKLTGRSIFEANKELYLTFNKVKTMASQIIRDTAQPILMEFSSTPQATVEEVRERGALFHYTQGDQGLVRLPPAAMPIELQAHLMEMRRELQKGSFNDAVYGMVEGQAGYALDRMADASANQILYPYMDAKHLIYEEGDNFWLGHLKSSKRVFEVKGMFAEKLKPTDIPEDVSVNVTSDVATPKDWLQRGQIANQLDKFLDENTIITEVLHMGDPQGIKRKKAIDRMLQHPMSQLVEMIAGYQVHADYLESRGDRRQAMLFRRAAQALEAQLGAPAPGQAPPAEMGEVTAAREAGAPRERTPLRPEALPPEERGFTPAQLRGIIGRGTIGR